MPYPCLTGKDPLMPWTSPRSFKSAEALVASEAYIRGALVTTAFDRPTPLSDAQKAQWGISHVTQDCYLKCDSDNRVDKDLDIVCQKGHDLSEFQKNPRLHWLHCKDMREDGQMLIGQTVAVWKEVDRGAKVYDRTMSIIAFCEGEDETALSRDISKLWRAGVLKASSIGFSIQDADYGFKYRDAHGEEQKGEFFMKATRRLEDSIVNSPANVAAGRVDLRQFKAYRTELVKGLDCTQDQVHRAQLEAAYEAAKEGTLFFDQGANSPETTPTSEVENSLAALSVQLKSLTERLSILEVKSASSAPTEENTETQETEGSDDPDVIFVTEDASVEAVVFETEG